MPGLVGTLLWCGVQVLALRPARISNEDVRVEASIGGPESRELLVAERIAVEGIATGERVTGVHPNKIIEGRLWYQGGWLGVERVEVKLANAEECEVSWASWRWFPSSANSLTLIYIPDTRWAVLATCLSFFQRATGRHRTPVSFVSPPRVFFDVYFKNLPKDGQKTMYTTENGEEGTKPWGALPSLSNHCLSSFKVWGAK